MRTHFGVARSPLYHLFRLALGSPTLASSGPAPPRKNGAVRGPRLPTPARAKNYAVRGPRLPRAHSRWARIGGVAAAPERPAPPSEWIQQFRIWCCGPAKAWAPIRNQFCAAPPALDSSKIHSVWRHWSAEASLSSFRLALGSPTLASSDSAPAGSLKD